VNSTASPAASAQAFSGWSTLLRERVEAALAARLPAVDAVPQRLHQAMRYACLGGGKRVRALLVYAAGEAAGAKSPALDAPACAVELIHAYSLVHDDLPTMDDDDLRRGKPTCHRAFDEATALLTGDALQTLAFQVLADDDAATATADRRLGMMRALAAASGSLGMAGGQAIDLAAVGHALNLEQLEHMHRLKTGALIRASVRLGALASAEAQESQLSALDRYAAGIGLAFQIQDDILDVESTTEVLGKRQGADAALDKPTYPSLLGLDESKARARRLYADAIGALEIFSDAGRRLRELAEFIIARAS
jgi:geranylgeranyl pyrophosphate synthase